MCSRIKAYVWSTEAVRECDAFSIVSVFEEGGTRPSCKLRDVSALYGVVGRVVAMSSDSKASNAFPRERHDGLFGP